MKDNGTPRANGSQPIADALHVAFVLDKSGSMNHLTNAVITGFDEFVDELRTGGENTLFTLTTFDTEFDHVHVAKALPEIPSLATTGYQPGGMTALFDAIAHSVIETDKRLAAEGRADEKVIVVVMTDGLENSSTDYSADTIANLVAGYDERPNWTFVYLGAAHDTLADAQNTADQMAFKRDNAMRWNADPASARKSMNSLASAANQRRRSTQMKSEQLFADAGQTELDYQDNRATPPTIQRRNLRDVLGGDSGGAQ